MGAVGETAADLVRGVPDHLSVMAYHVEVVVVASVGEVVLFQPPGLDGEEPEGEGVS